MYLDQNQQQVVVGALCVAAEKYREDAAVFRGQASGMAGLARISSRSASSTRSFTGNR
jgi:hypothetical protein